MTKPATLNVSLTPELLRWVKARVTSGRYGSGSEVIREALRMMQDHDQTNPTAPRARRTSKKMRPKKRTARA